VFLPKPSLYRYRLICPVNPNQGLTYTAVRVQVQFPPAENPLALPTATQGAPGPGSRCRVGMSPCSPRRLREEQKQNNAHVALLREPVKAGTKPRHVLGMGFVLPPCIAAGEPGAGLAPGDR